MNCLHQLIFNLLFNKDFLFVYTTKSVWFLCLQQSPITCIKGKKKQKNPSTPLLNTDLQVLWWSSADPICSSADSLPPLSQRLRDNQKLWGESRGLGHTMLFISIDTHSPAQKQARRCTTIAKGIQWGQIQKRSRQSYRQGTPEGCDSGPPCTILLHRESKYNMLKKKMA